MALCSLSIGSKVAPLSCTASMNSWPDMTSASLLASKTFLPARAAASDGARPAAPTMAAMTVSVAGLDATAHSAASPKSTSVLKPLALSNLDSCSAACSVPTTARTGWNCSHWAASSSTREWAVSAYTRYLSGWRATTSRVDTPIEPVAPRMVMLCILSSWTGNYLSQISISAASGSTGISASMRSSTPP